MQRVPIKISIHLRSVSTGSLIGLGFTQEVFFIHGLAAVGVHAFNINIVKGMNLFGISPNLNKFTHCELIKLN